MKTFSAILFLSALLLLTFSASAQKTQPTTPNDDDAVVKVTTDLVQIDAVITDKKGNQITDLAADDIEILQDGKPQTITSFSYVNREAKRQNQINPANNKVSDKNAVPVPPVSPVSARPDTLGRVLTFIVDDGNCSLTAFGMKAAREGLEKFVNEQMLPNDLVAIYKTRRGNSLLQQYTSDKARLLSTIRKIQWYPPDGACSITGDSYERSRHEGTKYNEKEPLTSENDSKKAQAIENYNRDKQTVGTVGVLRYAIRGLQNIGGRKTLFLLSDSLPISNGKSNLFESFYAVQDLTRLANRSSVVINTIDVRGLYTTNALAFDGFKIKQDMMAVDRVVEARQLSNDSRQSGLTYAAAETGGKFYGNMNNLDYPIQEVLKTEKGYYLIGYQPDEETFKGKKFHKIEIKVKRPDLIVSSRSGFNNFTDEEIRPKKRTGDSELYEAIVAPLPNAGLDVSITAFFANTPSEGSFVRTLLHIDGKQIAFTDDGNNTKKAVFDVIAVTLNEKNDVVDEFNRTHTIKVPSANLAQIQQNGLIYSADIPVKKAGAYNFRVAVRDANSKQIGSAGQQIEVPDLKKSKILVSGLTLGEVQIKDGKPVMPSIEKAENAFAPVLTPAIPAIRRFRPGAVLGYSYKIYNARIEQNLPKLTTQIILYRDGQPISDNQPQPSQIDPQTDLTRINDYGYMRLPSDIQTGDYALQIVIKDLQSNETSSQWIDFEVIR